jgi:hypothetical protein
MLPGIGTPVKASGRSVNYWTLEWTYSNGTGTPVLDTSQSDEDPRVATPVADGGTGLTSVRLPKGRRYRIVHCSLEEPTLGTSAQSCKLGDLDPDAGTATFAIYSAVPALQDATSGSRARITVDIDYQ